MMKQKNRSRYPSGNQPFSRRHVRQIWQKYHAPKHIIAHMQKVAAVAMFIANRLKKKSININMKELQAAALLHDLVKVCDFPELDLQYFEQPYTEKDVDFWKNLITT